MSKKKLAVIFGGQSSEHSVSCMSVQNVVANVDTDKYDIKLIGITKDGKWLAVDSVDSISDGSWVNSKVSAAISPDVSANDYDVAFPVLHGTHGEDGMVQGLLELAKIPYVGCGVLSSAITMDKYFTKLIVEKLKGVTQAEYELILSRKLPRKMNEYVERVENHLGYPVFIKPANEGSSYGVSCAHNREELIKGINEAAKFDSKILVEERIMGREIECALLGYGDNVSTSGVGEILAAADFYDFDAKYNNPESVTVVNPDIDPAAVEKIRKNAVTIFKAVDGFGLSRADFFVKDDGTVVFNEINTIPGFTGISMYPMLWEAAGIGKKELVNKLIDLAFERDKL